MIRIVTDSLCDISPEEAKELGIELFPLTVRFGEESYRSGIDLTNEEFYEKLVTSKDSPATAAVNPYDFEKKFKEYLEQGDEVIGILFTKKLSATFQSAQIAKDNLNSDKIHLIDTTTGSVAQAVLIHVALKMREEGKSAEEIVEKVTKLTERVEVFLALDTLEYLKRGGRISPSVAFVGGVLGVHPIICIKDGKIDILDKIKGKKKINNWFLDKLKELPMDKDYPLMIAHANAPEKAAKLAKLLEENSYGKDFPTYCIGPSIGTHLGPDTIGISYIVKK